MLNFSDAWDREAVVEGSKRVEDHGNVDQLLQNRALHRDDKTKCRRDHSGPRKTDTRIDAFQSDKS
jgi:hypothetical protein